MTPWPRTRSPRVRARLAAVAGVLVAALLIAIGVAGLNSSVLGVKSWPAVQRAHRSDPAVLTAPAPAATPTTSLPSLGGLLGGRPGGSALVVPGAGAGVVLGGGTGAAAPSGGSGGTGGAGTRPRARPGPASRRAPAGAWASTPTWCARRTPTATACPTRSSCAAA